MSEKGAPVERLSLSPPFLAYLSYFADDGLVRAALSSAGDSDLWRIVDQLRESPLAKNRALAVSILAWIGTPKAIKYLDRFRMTDASDWVRDHAEWGSEVARGEDSARRSYGKLLRQQDAVDISVKLEILQPALTPMATWWHVHVEESEPTFPTAARAAAVIKAFWYQQSATHKSSVSVYGRRLDEYCRGDRIGSIHKPMLAPWWEP